MTLQHDLFADAAPPRPRTQTRSGEEGRNRALDLLEARRTAYVMRARAVAEAIFARQGFVTVDCIRRECPPPEEIDGRVMGAVLRPPRWRVEGEAVSERKINHAKRIARFIRAEKAREA